MLVCAAGDVHGDFTGLYERVGQLEARVGRPVDLVLQVGDLGAWPDTTRADAPTKRRGVGEFPRWWAAGRSAPWRTVFIAGNHEDFDFLVEKGAAEVLPGLTFLPWGEALEFGAGSERLWVGGVGGCYGPKDYGRLRLSGPSRRHYSRHDVERLAGRSGPALDVLLLHEPPAGPLEDLCPRGERARRLTTQGEGLVELVAKIQPRICFTGHVHMRTERRVAGVRTVGLNLVPHAGSVMLLEFTPGREPEQLAEWGGERLLDGGAQASVAAPAAARGGHDEVEALVQLLEAWAGRAGGGSPGRERRMALHRALSAHPWRRLLMAALRGRDLAGEVEHCVPADQRASLLRSLPSALPELDG